MKYNINNEEVNVEIVRKNNKNTYIRVKEDGTIYVTTSYLMTDKKIIKLLDQNKTFLQKSLNKIKKKTENNNIFCYLGRVYDIITMDVKKIEVYDSRIFVRDKNMLQSFVKKQTKKIFSSELDRMYKIFEEQIPYPNLKIRSMKTRWGVCNKKTKTITLNSELIKYDIEKLDYVIIHELSHFIHFNHSKDFWNLVGKYIDYKRIRKDLREG